MHWYLHQLRSGKMGAAKRNDVNTAHDTVKYCTNTPKGYKSPKIEYFLINFLFGMYWELYRLRSSKMGAYQRNIVNTDHNAVKYCTNTPKWHELQKTKNFLALLIFWGQFA